MSENLIESIKQRAQSLPQTTSHVLFEAHKNLPGGKGGFPFEKYNDVRPVGLAKKAK